MEFSTSGNKATDNAAKSLSKTNELRSSLAVRASVKNEFRQRQGDRDPRLIGDKILGSFAD